MKGSAARMKGVWRKSFLVLIGFSAADFIAAEVSLSRVSVEAFAESRARVGGIFIADMVLGIEWVSKKVCMSCEVTRKTARTN